MCRLVWPPARFGLLAVWLFVIRSEITKFTFKIRAAKAVFHGKICFLIGLLVQELVVVVVFVPVCSIVLEVVELDMGMPSSASRSIFAMLCKK